MYRLGRKGHAKAKKRTWRVMLAILLVVLATAATGAYFIIRSLEPEPTVPQAITREFVDKRDNTDRVFAEDGFTLSLPNDWVLRDKADSPYVRYSWQATEKNADNRWLDVYVDSSPPNLAFNRLLPVTVESGKVIISGSVSDNCSTFGTVGATPNAMQQPTVTAKWQGIEFQCDMANYSRNVVGVGTLDSQNRILLTTTGGTQRSFIFVYTDHNVSPNYQILENALKSLSLQ